MAIKIFDFLSKKVDDAEIADSITAKLANQIYFKELALYIAISYIANTISKCEIKTYENGEEVRGELYYLLNVNPNPNQGSSQFMNMLIERYFRYGEALVVPYRHKLYIADGFSQDEKPLSDNIFNSISLENQTISRNYKASDVFYFKLDNTRVKGLIDALYDDYGALMAALIGSVKDSNSQKYKLILENYAAGDQSFLKIFNEQLADSIKSFINSDKGVYPEYRGTNLTRLDKNESGTTVDSVVTMRKEIFDTVAQAFKIPLTMMYGNITNMNEIVKVYLSICIDPIAQMISEEFTRKTTTYDTWRAGNYVRVDTSKINHIDPFEIADKADKLISSGIYTIDSVLDRFGDDKLNTDFSTQHWMTKNYSPIEQVADPIEGGETVGQA